MRGNISLLFLAGSVICSLSFLVSFIRSGRVRNYIFAGGVLCTSVSCIIKIILNWPLVTLFQESYLISAACGIISIYMIFFTGFERVTLLLTGLTASVSLFSAFFPADIYVSFIKTNTIFAHIFSVFSSGARAAYMVSFVLALYGVFGKNEESFKSNLLRFNTNLIIAGFAMQCIGMFSGAMWSFVGWGNPVQWQSHIFLAMAGVWFYYSWYLHLKIGRKTENSKLFKAALLGGLLTILFTYIPDTGKFAIPGGM